MKYENHYTKYWPNQELWHLAFTEALPNADKGTLKFAVERQYAELVQAAGEVMRRYNDAERPRFVGQVTVDVDARFCPNIIASEGDEILHGADARDGELAFLRQLAARRDQPLAECKDLPPAYWQPASVLADLVVEAWPGQDFLADEHSYEMLHEHGLLVGSYSAESSAERLGDLECATLRHWAEYVHNDNPIIQWSDFTAWALRHRVPVRADQGLLDIAGNKRFGSGGPPWIGGAFGEVLRALAPISFAGKWRRLVKRPEQWAATSLGGFLPQTFPEGSPAHPSRYAMHYRAAQIMAYFASMVFDPYAPVPDYTGEMVPLYHELQLMADNISYARCTAGVHYESDNEDSVRCATFAEDMAERIFGVPCQVPQAMVDLSFARR